MSYKLFKYYILLTLCNLALITMRAQNSSQKVKENFSSKNYQLTLDELNSISSSEINFDSLLYIKAYSQIKLNQLREANGTLLQLQQLNPNYYEAYFLKGLISSIKEKYADAISNFNKVIDKNPTHEKALYNRAIAKGLLEDYKNAIQDLNSCITINPSYTLAYYNRGYWHELSQQNDKAILDYKKTIELDKHYTEAYIALTYLYSQTGNTTEACETIQKAKKEGIEAANDLINLFCK